MFKWGRSKQSALRAIAPAMLFDPVALLPALDRLVAGYLKKTDEGELVYPACRRTSTDVDGDVGAIWADTRLEAVRYVMLVPGCDFDLLLRPARQAEMVEVFLRQPRHEQTVVDFKGASAEDLSVAILAGLNWLDHCASLVPADPDRFRRTQRDFRRLVELAQEWWAMEGATERCEHMLAAREIPPLMFYLVWQDYTRLAKEIAIAAIYGSSLDDAVERQRTKLHSTHGAHPRQLESELAALAENADRLRRASDPFELADL